MEQNIFDLIDWRDPISQKKLIPIVSARTPVGTPICGAFKIEGTDLGWPIVDCVARLTLDSAIEYEDWLLPYGLSLPTDKKDNITATFQELDSVSSFGFQWGLAGVMRSEEDLQFRVAKRFGKSAEFFSGKLVLDAGSGAGDQSRWLLKNGASVISVDLSNAINVTAQKLKNTTNWFGVQGDITALPFAPNQFEIVYCEGVIQHTRDSALCVKELSRILKADGELLATHYIKTPKLLNSIRILFQELIRKYLSKLERFSLLLITGILSALSYIPIIGWPLRKAGVVLYQPSMSSFKTTWINTFDCYGNHHFQRVITSEKFRSYFEVNKDLVIFKHQNDVIVSKKLLSK